MLRSLFLLALLLTACRVERYDVVAARDSAAVADSLRWADTLFLPGPPVGAGDTLHPLPESLPAPLPKDSARAPAVTPPDARPAVPPAAPSGLILPVEGVKPQDLVDTFSNARGQGRRHDAIDIPAPRGTRVLAATSGRILRLFTSERGGLTIYQLGDDGRTVYYYAHLDGYAPGLAQDQRVAQGDVIGTVGDTGNAVPGNTHLHFAVWTIEDPQHFWDGENLNPYPLLGGR